MAKRAPVNERPFNALDKGLAASVMQPMNDDDTSSTAVAEVAPPAPETGLERPESGRAAETPLKANERRVEAPAAIPGPSIMARRPVMTPKPAVELAPEKLTREKRVLLSAAEDREIGRCVDRIAEGFGGTPVKLSHVLRACLTVIRHAENEIIRHAQEADQLTRPPNGDALALAEFEQELAKVLAKAFRDAPPFRK